VRAYKDLTCDSRALVRSSRPSELLQLMEITSRVVPSASRWCAIEEKRERERVRSAHSICCTRPCAVRVRVRVRVRWCVRAMRCVFGVYHGSGRGGEEVLLIEHDQRARVHEGEDVGLQRRIRGCIEQADLDVRARESDASDQRSKQMRVSVSLGAHVCVSGRPHLSLASATPSRSTSSSEWRMPAVSAMVSG
jgi:hypothetical protein